MPLRSLGLVLILLMPALVAAEVYRYIDENGVIRFTDNYIEIPASQRSEVETITRPEETAQQVIQSEPNRVAEPRPLGESDASERSSQEPGSQETEAVAASEQSKLQFEALIKAKAGLDKMFSALTAEKEALETEQKTLKTVESIRVYQEKVNRFNQRLADYEQLRQAFQTQADAYNRTVSK